VSGDTLCFTPEKVNHERHGFASAFNENNMYHFKQMSIAFRFHKVKIWRLEVSIPLPEWRTTEIEMDGHRKDAYLKK